MENLLLEQRSLAQAPSQHQTQQQPQQQTKQKRQNDA
jgi:hypothetical protein